MLNTIEKQFCEIERKNQIFIMPCNSYIKFKNLILIFPSISKTKDTFIRQSTMLNTMEITAFKYFNLQQNYEPQYPHRWSYNFYVHFSNPFIFIKSFLEDL